MGGRMAFGGLLFPHMVCSVPHFDCNFAKIKLVTMELPLILFILEIEALNQSLATQPRPNGSISIRITYPVLIRVTSRERNDVSNYGKFGRLFNNLAGLSALELRLLLVLWGKRGIHW